MCGLYGIRGLVKPSAFISAATSVKASCEANLNKALQHKHRGPEFIETLDSVSNSICK